MPQDLPGASQDGFPLVTDLTAIQNFINSLGLQGAVPTMDAVPRVVPVAVVANPIPTTVTAAVAVPFTSSDVHSDSTTTPGAGAVLADTGALPAGQYAVIVGWSGSSIAQLSQLQLQHRNAANAANLTVWEFSFTNVAGNLGIANSAPLVFDYRIALNERLRFLNVLAITDASSRLATNIMAVRVGD